MNNKEKFIEKANKIHNNFYDYSLVEYINYRTKITVNCLLHGNFDVYPKSHLKSSGCKLCVLNKNNRCNYTIFVRRAKDIHNNIYEYPLQIISKYNQDVKIIYKYHGNISINGVKHIHHKMGCNLCSKDKLRTVEQFINDSISIHGNKYDYSKFVYTNNKTKSIIICNIPEHGEFLQTANHHLNGNGCSKCGKLKASESRKKSDLTSIIEKLNNIHENKYSYLNDRINGLDTVLNIVCKKHGYFEKTLKSHMHSKSGCDKCSRNVYTYEEIMELSNKIHNSFYDYTEAFKVYNSNCEKIPIICPVHRKI